MHLNKKENMNLKFMLLLLKLIWNKILTTAVDAYVVAYMLAVLPQPRKPIFV